MPGLKPEDIRRFVTAGEPQLSPDGSQVVYTVSTLDKKTDRPQTSLWICPTTGETKPRQLTRGGKERSPRWCPDGKTLSFISDRTGKPQVWLMRLDGGEAWQVPTERRIGGVTWSPDGKSFAFTAQDFTKTDDWVPYPGAPEDDRKRAVAQAKQILEGPKKPPTGNNGDWEGEFCPEKDTPKGKPEERPEGEPEDPPEESKKKAGPDKPSDVKVTTRFSYKSDGMGVRNDLSTHIYVCDVDENILSGQMEPGDDGKTQPAKRVTDGDYNHSSPRWSPDGKYLVLCSLRRDDAEFLSKGDMWLLNVKTSQMVQLFDGSGPVQSPVFSPNGRNLAFGGHDGSFGMVAQGGLWVLDVSGFINAWEEGPDAPSPLTHKDARCLTSCLDRPVGFGSMSDVHYGMTAPFVWENDDSLLFLLGKEGAGTLWRVSLSDAQPQVIWEDESRNLVGFSHQSGRFVLQIGGLDETEELYIFNEQDSSLFPITDCNPWLKTVSLGKTQRLRFKGADDWDVEGFLTYPVGYEEGKTYPLALLVHGGPASAYGPNFSTHPQLLAARGFAVLCINPRGSTTYGQEFLHAVVEDWGGKDYQDLMAGVDKAIEIGVADPNNLFVTGWSYGGYMTTWIVTQTSRFNAAIGGAIISDLYSMHSTQDIVLYGEYYFGGTPWDNREKLLSRSPMTYVKNVTTPFMVLHGELDTRCPTSQGDMFYSALKRQGKTAVYVRYPGTYHGLRKLDHKIDRFKRTTAWFEHYIKR